MRSHAKNLSGVRGNKLPPPLLTQTRKALKAFSPLLSSRLTSRPLLLFMIVSVFALTWLAAPVPSVLTANPMSGTLTESSGPLTYNSGPFFVANPSAQATGTPTCNAALPCDDYTLTVNIPASFITTHRVKVVIEWPVAAADFDLYVLQGTTGNTVVTSAASSSDPEVALFAPISGVYRIRVAPFAPGGQSFTGTISLVPLPPLPGQPPGIAPRYQNYPGPSGTGVAESGEPSIGIDWNITCPPATCPNLHPSPAKPKLNTGGIAFFTANLNEYRVSFDDCSSPAMDLWEDKTSPIQGATTLDPIGFIDSATGRVFHSQLTGAGSLLAFSTNDGETWSQSQGAGLPAGVDHQTVGGGPYNENSTPPPPPHPLYPNAVYYASQDVATAFIARSDNGGATFGAGIPMWNLTQCGGLHGHIKVAPDGTVYVPNKGCGGQQGVAVSTDNGLTWAIRTVAGSSPGDTDPSLGIATDGTIYLGYQNGDGHPHMARSTDKGVTWIDRDVGGGFIQNCVFPEVVAGDGDRAAFGFIGTPAGGNYQDTANFHGIWHFYIATTYDRGLTYFLVDATPNDPVQIGSICTGGTTCGSDRNLLDFNDIGVDKQGRVLVALADGCVAPGCKENPPSPSGSSRSALGTIIRQSGGRRLFSAFDPVEPAQPAAPRLISATRDSSGVTITWFEPDNSGSPLTGYKIYRGTTRGAETLLATIGPSAPRYLDAMAAPGVQYVYRVSALNALGEGPFCGDVEVTGAPPIPNRCLTPGIEIFTDPAGDQTGNPANTQLDIRQVSIAEPFLNTCTNQLVFTMKVADLSVVPPQARWTIFFSRPNGVEHFVNMSSDEETNPTGVVFKYGHTSIGPGGIRQLTTDGDADAGSGFVADGTITIIASNSKFTFNPAGPPHPPPGPGEAFGNVNAITQQTIGVLLATLDSTATGGYSVAGNISCQENTAPIAVLGAMPNEGTAPLMVNFDGSASNDSDLCDTVASYTFDFGDGSAAVTQATPTTSHVYNTAGEYRATLKVTDSRGLLSGNTSVVIIDVADCTEETTIAPDGECFIYSGGSSSISVSRPTGCTWMATSNAQWINITSGTGGSGNGNVNFTVAANPDNARRVGTMLIAGKVFTVLQGRAFADVPEGHPFFNEVQMLSARGITSGCTTTNFCPSFAVTREQMAIFIVHALGIFNPPAPTSQRFDDVPPTRIGYAFIEELARRGITVGCGGNNFCPDAPVTREQMAAFIIRALGTFNPPVPTSQRFDDVPPQNPFYAFIDQMAVRGITLGCSTSPPLYCPSSSVTREQMAAFLVRAFGCP
jgi:PKD domain-containing protein/S-layer family protein/BACON domain-containing protein/fibronectin type III domain protein